MEIKRLISFILLLCIFAQSAYSQSLLIDWQTTLGGDDLDDLYDVSPCSDGGAIIIGLSTSSQSSEKSENSMGDEDYWVVKLSASGNLEWENTIGGDNIDRGFTAMETSDGGFFIGGFSTSTISGDRTDGPIAGCNAADYWVLKLDNNGVIQWQNAVGGGGGDILTTAAQTSDNGFILGGYSGSDISGDKTEDRHGPPNSGFDFWVVKLDSLGNVEWDNTIGGDGDEYLSAPIVQLADGSYILGGSSVSMASSDKSENPIANTYDFWIVKLDPNGTIIWDNTIGGIGYDEPKGIVATADGGSLIGGFSDSYVSGDKTEASQSFDFWLVKLDTMGNVEWDKTIGGTGVDWLCALEGITDGGFIAGGFSTSDSSGDKTENGYGGKDFWFIKMDSLANIEHQITLGGSSDDYLMSLAEDVNGNFLVGGISASGISGNKDASCRGFRDYWVLKLRIGLDTTTTAEISNALDAKEYNIYPNPTKGILNFEIPGDHKVNIKLYNLQGKEVGNFNDTHIDIQHLARGTYIAQIRVGDSIETIKVIKE